jgi:hypothetical protein
MFFVMKTAVFSQKKIQNIYLLFRWNLSFGVLSIFVDLTGRANVKTGFGGGFNVATAIKLRGDSWKDCRFLKIYSDPWDQIASLSFWDTRRLKLQKNYINAYLYIHLNTTMSYLLMHPFLVYLIPVEKRGFSLPPKHPHRLWGPPRFLFEGFRGLFPRE